MIILNPGKAQIIITFLYLCHAVTQYFIDLFWQRQDFSGALSDLPTVHRGVKRFGITTRLSQALAKQAKECVRSQHKKGRKDKPELSSHTVTLYYHFVTIEPFQGEGFDWAVRLIGSGAPKLTIPVPSTKPIMNRLQDGWGMSKTLRLGLRNGRLFIDFLFEKERPSLKEDGRVVGMDSNYKNGLVFSVPCAAGVDLYPAIQGKAPRQKHTTSQFCRHCCRWDRRNRRGDRFKCVHCGYSAHADHNASHNLEFLGLAGVYGLRLLPSSKCQSLG